MSMPRPKPASRSAGWRELREQAYRQELEYARGVLRAKRWQLRAFVAMVVLAIVAIGAGGALLAHGLGWTR